MASPNAERMLKRLRKHETAVQLAKKFPGGKAWTSWESWTLAQRKHFLTVYCQLSDAQVKVFAGRPYYSLNGHVRTSVKRFFRTAPTVDLTLAAMRYPEREKK